MYGQTHHFDLPLISLTYETVTIRAHATPTTDGIEFRFTRGENPYVSGKLTIRTDAHQVTEIELGSEDPEDWLEVGDWGLAHLRIGPGSTDTLAEEGIDGETLDTLRSLIYSAIGYTQGHTNRIRARITAPPRAITR